MAYTDKEKEKLINEKLKKVPIFTLIKIEKFIEFSIFCLIGTFSAYMYLKFGFEVLTGKQDFFLFMMVNVLIGFLIFFIMAFWERK